MALFPGVTGSLSYKGRTHVGLVVSEGNAPAEKFLVSKNEAVKFSYPYGPEGNQNVVIAKGKAVQVAGVEYDYVTSHNFPAVKTADVDSKFVLGINHHNLYEVKRDRFSGNQPVIITRNYIELPYFESGVDAATASGAAAAMNFGAAYAATASALTAGDYVKVGDNGNLTKWVDGTDSPLAVVGQVWAVETELPPLGLLAYYMDMKIEDIESFIKGSSYAPSPGKNGNQTYDAPTAGDAGAYPLGYPWTLHSWKTDFEKLLNPTLNKGIPFLTDGYFKAKQNVTGIAINDIYDATTAPSGQVEYVTYSGGVTFGHEDAVTPGQFDPSAGNAVDAGVQTAADTRNNAIFIKLRNPIDRYELDNLKVYKDGVVAPAADVHVDLYNNIVVLYLDPSQTVLAVTLDVPQVVDPVAGVPTEWDYAGAVGAVRILLQK